MSAMIRIVIADDHPVVRRGLWQTLGRQPHLEVVGEASDGRDALNLARTLKPDLLILDIDMPQMNGMAVTDVLHREMPEIKVLIISVHTNTDYVMRIIQCGARGFVLKESPPEEILQAVETVLGGGTHFSPEVARVALNQVVRGNRGDSSAPLSQLTNREREVLLQIAEGLSNKEIASCLSIGVRTVETHRERIMRKLDIHSVAGLTRFAIAHGLVTLAPYGVGPMGMPAMRAA